MGYRTVVVLYNDHSSTWENDTQLGKKIARASFENDGYVGFGVGQVVECVHADSTTLAVLDSYTFQPIAHGQWNPRVTGEEQQLKLLRDAAAKMGYKLVKNT